MCLLQEESVCNNNLVGNIGVLGRCGMRGVAVSAQVAIVPTGVSI